MNARTLQDLTKEERLTMMFESQSDMIRKGLYKGINEELPKFSGDYKSWNQWYQQFISLVGTNPRFPTIVKYRKLLRSLEGEALDSVSHFEFDEATYELVKEALIEQYGEDQLVMSDMIRQV